MNQYVQASKLIWKLLHNLVFNDVSTGFKDCILDYIWAVIFFHLLCVWFYAFHVYFICLQHSFHHLRVFFFWFQFFLASVLVEIWWNSCCLYVFAVHPKSGGQHGRTVWSRPYADPYSTVTEEMPSDLSLWSDNDDEARRLIYSNSMSDIVSAATVLDDVRHRWWSELVISWASNFCTLFVNQIDSYMTSYTTILIHFVILKSGIRLPLIPRFAIGENG